MNIAPVTQLKKGTLLIASPEIESGLFFRGVLLLCEHNASGSFAILINKPLNLELPDEIASLSTLANPRVSMRAGGPIQTHQMMLLHTKDDSEQRTLNICDGVFLGGDLHLLQEMLADESGSPVQLCFGYAGWGSGQLEREFLDGNWFIHPASKRHIFDIQASELWKTVLQEMGGKFATLSMIPEDLSVN